MSNSTTSRRPGHFLGGLFSFFVILMMTLPPRPLGAQTDPGMTLVADGGASTIDAFGVCRVVQNATGLEVMVPHSIPEEWYTGGNSFLENIPENMSASACPTSVAGDCFDPRFVGYIGEPDWSGGLCDGMLIVDNEMMTQAASPTSCEADDYESANYLLSLNMNTGNYVDFMVSRYNSTGTIFQAVNLDNAGDLSSALQINYGIVDSDPIGGQQNTYVWSRNRYFDLSTDVVGDLNAGGNLLDGNPVGTTTFLDPINFTTGGVILNYRLQNPAFPSEVIMPNGIGVPVVLPQDEICGDGSFAITGPDNNSYSFEDSQYNVFTGQVTAMAELFRDTSFNGDIGYWYTSHVLSLYGLFRDNPVFNQDLSSWDTSSVRDMRYVFAGASSFDQPIGGWTMSNVTNAAGMFRNATSFNKPVSDWDTGKLSYMVDMFRGAASFNQPIGSWNVLGVSSLEAVFQSASSFDQDLSEWDVSNVRTLERLFRDATAFNGNVSGWDVGQVTSLRETFNGAASFNQPLSGWETGNVTTLDGAFLGASAFNQPLETWNVSAVENMNGAFRDAVSFDQELNGWDVSRVRSANYMFAGASVFNRDLDLWDVSSFETMNFMFSGATTFNASMSGWDLASVMNGGLNFMFNGATSFNSNISDWCVYEVDSTPFRFAPTLNAARAPRWGTCPSDPCNVAVTPGAVCRNGDVYAGTYAGRRIFVAPANEILSGFSPLGGFSNSESVPWLSSFPNLSGSAPNATSTTDGLTNTQNLYNKSSRDFIAASLCFKKAPQQYQWYLPSTGELGLLYQNRAVLPNMFPGFSTYWSSTAISTSGGGGGILSPFPSSGFQMTPKSAKNLFGSFRISDEWVPSKEYPVRCVRRN